jgi:hypothetical protein
MKRILVITLLISLTGTAVRSQVLISLFLGDKLNAPGLEFGLEGGYNWSNLTGMESKSPQSAFALGFYFDIRVKNQWSLYTGIMVKSKLGLAKLSDDDLAFLGTEVYDAPGDYQQVISYFQLPVLAKYKFKNFMYVEAGPQFGLMHKPYVEYVADIEGKQARIREPNTEMIQRIDGGITAGLGYTLMKGKGMTLGIKYYSGFWSVYKDRSGVRNQYILLKFNIPVGKGEKKNSEAKPATAG